ncbi:MAG: hypothetical protein ACRC1Y_06230 [Paraclostridium sp.]
MKNKNCSRRKIIKREFINDWDELNIAFKALIFIGITLFIVIISLALFSDGGICIRNSLEVVFRSTLASVFGFLLSSNIKINSKKKDIQIQKIQSELKKVQLELNALDKASLSKLSCDLENNYTYKDINIVQIIIALSICIISILITCSLLMTNNLENIPAISQIRDLMCSSIGFLIGESGKK